MTKSEIATYLIALNALMQAQGAAGNPTSQALAHEYDKYWDKLKAEIAKGDEDETRHRPSLTERPQDGAKLPGGEPRRSGSDR